MNSQLTTPALVAATLAVICASCGFAFAQSPLLTFPSGQEVINYLNKCIDWYRQITFGEQIATDPTDVIFLNDDRQTASEILPLRGLCIEPASRWMA